MKKLQRKLTLFLLLGYSLIDAQELPPIFDGVPHALVPGTTLASFPENTFLENILPLSDGSVLVNSHVEGVVYKVNAQGTAQKFASVNGKLTGIARYGEHHFILTGNDEKDQPALFLLNDKGSLIKITTLSDGQFLNGIAHWKGDEFLVADSYKGCLWLVDVKTKKRSVWLSHDLLSRKNEQNPTPAVNGIKIFGDAVYVSNTQRQQLIRIGWTGDKPAAPVVVVDRVNLDDFTFDDAGILYGATHVYNSIIRITPDKQVTVIAEQPQGVAGSTACVLQKTTSGYRLLVSTNGGMYLPPASGIEKSKIVSLQVQ